jgi:hypothetical protein
MFRREAVSPRVYETPIAKLSESFRRRKNLEIQQQDLDKKIKKKRIQKLERNFL